MKETEGYTCSPPILTDVEAPVSGVPLVMGIMTKIWVQTRDHPCGHREAVVFSTNGTMESLGAGAFFSFDRLGLADFIKGLQNAYDSLPGPQHDIPDQS